MNNNLEKKIFEIPSEEILINHIKQNLEISGNSDAMTLFLRGYLAGLSYWGILDHLDKNPIDQLNHSYKRLTDYLPDVGIVEEAQFHGYDMNDEQNISDFNKWITERQLQRPERNRRNLKGTPSLGD